METCRIAESCLEIGLVGHSFLSVGRNERTTNGQLETFTTRSASIEIDASNREETATFLETQSLCHSKYTELCVL